MCATKNAYENGWEIQRKMKIGKAVVFFVKGIKVEQLYIDDAVKKERKNKNGDCVSQRKN